MQLSFTMSTLLAGIIVMLSLQVVDSLSLPNRGSKLLTFPLTPIPRRTDIHPQILLQMHINRGIRRLAKMTGVDPPPARSLEQCLERRVLSVEGPDGFYKRFDRFGVPGRREVQLERRFDRTGVIDPVPGSSPLSLKTGEKQGTASASTVSIANTPSTANSLGLDIEADDAGYLATVQIGTPPQNFLILMDSGSADLWVGAENCQSTNKGGCGNHAFLGTQSSSSFQDTQKPFKVTYGTGEVVGSIVQDNVVIAGLSLTNHTFGVASEESVQFTSAPFDGLMGLAKSTLSEQRTATPVEALASAGLIPDSIVSYKISRLADNSNDGEITFGGLDTTKFDSKTLINVPNVNSQGFWEADLDSSTVNGVDTGLTGRTTILDTGTTLMILPPDDAAAIHKAIPGAQQDNQGGFTVPCTTNASVALTYSGQSFTIDPRDLAFQTVDPNDPQGDCISGIAAGTVGSTTQWLVGDTFLKNAYFSTDVSKNTLSLAKLV